jgi:hypothetical protein
LIVLLFMGGIYSHNNDTRAERALCQLRANIANDAEDTNRSLQRSEDFLGDLDSGKRKPIPGITRADIVRNIEQQQATLERQRNNVAALSDLNCG